MEENKIRTYIKKLEEIQEIIDQNSENIDEADSRALANEIDSVFNYLAIDINQSIAQEQFANIMPVKIKKLRPDAVIPKYAKYGDAGMDLTATHIIKENSTYITYGTGIAMEIPEGYVGLLFPRSSIRGVALILSNSVGVIDHGYRGEIQCTFKRTSDNDKEYSPQYGVGDRISQIVIMPFPKINFVEVSELSESERNSGGFGSTGK